MKLFLTSILFCTAIILTVFAINMNNPILAVIGGCLSAVYNAIIDYKKD